MKRILCIVLLMAACFAWVAACNDPDLSDVNPEAALLVDSLRAAADDFLASPNLGAAPLASLCRDVPATGAELGVSETSMGFLLMAVLSYQLAIETVIAPQPGNSLDIREAVSHADDTLDIFARMVIKGE